MAQPNPHWLTNYSNNQHPWLTKTSPNGQISFQRSIGLVETSFDTDGTYFGGRADMTATLSLELEHHLPRQEFRRRIALAWTLLRLEHTLLSARVDDDETGKKSFCLDVPGSAGEALQSASETIVHLDDQGFDPSLNPLDLHHHALNVARIIQPAHFLSKLHVQPPKPLALQGRYELRFLIIIAHQISDGLSAYNWFSHFIRILNTPLTAIESEISRCINASQLEKKLPPAQGDLYPKVQENRARQRWFWAIIRVLRHVQKTMPPTFLNPPRREVRLEGALPLPHTYASVFDYTEANRPPMSSGHISASLSPKASARMVTLCRESSISIGAGCFALAGLAMMKIHEERYKDSDHPAFGASFPLNPRAFFTPKQEANSCMLAFSEGILMPFLPSSLPIEGRFKLVAKHANRELRVYQKRLKDGSEGLGSFDKHSPSRLLATGYLAQIERVDAKLPAERRTGYSPQGDMRPRVGEYGATCGVSSMGSMAAYFKPGAYGLENLDGKDFVADYRGLKIGVRARDNEFLIGSSSDADGIVGFGVSYDENAISQEAAVHWAKTISGLLEEGETAKL